MSAVLQKIKAVPTCVVCQVSVSGSSFVFNSYTAVAWSCTILTPSHRSFPITDYPKRYSLLFQSGAPWFFHWCLQFFFVCYIYMKIDFTEIIMNMKYTGGKRFEIVQARTSIGRVLQLFLLWCLGYKVQQHLRNMTEDVW